MESKSNENAEQGEKDGKAQAILSSPSSSSLIYLAASNTMYYNLVIGIKKASPVFFMQFQNELNASAAETTLIYSVYFMFFYMGGPFFGSYLKMTGAKITLLTAATLYALSSIATSLARSYVEFIIYFSVLRGIGSGLAFLSVYAINGQTFSSHLPLVNSTMAATSSILGAIVAPLFQLGIDYYTWRGVMLILGAVLLNMVPVGWITANLFQTHVKSAKPEKVSTRNACKIIASSFNVHLLKDMTFVIYLLANCGIQTTRLLQGVYLVRYSQSIGISDQASSLFVTMFQVSYIVSCLLTGYLMSRMAAKAIMRGTPVSMKTSSIIICTTLTQCCINFIPILSETYYGYTIYVILTGMLSGTCGNLPITIVSELFGKKTVSSALGFRAFFLGIVLTTAPPILGMIIDAMGTYKPVMYAMSLFSFVGSILLKVVQIRVDRRDKISADLTDHSKPKANC